MSLRELYGRTLRALGRGWPAPALGAFREAPPDDPAALDSLPVFPRSETPGDAAQGYGLLGRWRDAARTLVDSREPSGTRIVGRSVELPGMPAATAPHLLCDARNLYLRHDRIGSRDDLRYRPGYQRVASAYPDFAAGALAGFGVTAQETVPLEKFPRDHLRDAFASLVLDPRLPEQAPDEVVAYPALLVSREPLEYRNLFHAHTDLLNAFQAVWMLDLDPNETGVFLFDGYAPGPFDSAFRSAFSRRHPLRRIERGVRRTTRFEHAVFVPPGYSSILWSRLHEREPACGALGLVRDYGRFLLRAFAVERARVPGDAEPVRALLVSRRPYRGSVHGAYLRNQFRDEAGLLDALRAIPSLVASRVDLAEHSFAEQLRLVANAELLIGAHGAGLAHLLCIAEHGAVIEVVAAPPARETYWLYPHLGAAADRPVVRVPARERFRLHGTELAVEPRALAHEAARLAVEIRERRKSAREPAAS